MDILSSQRGIALLVAALISALVVSIGAAMYSIVQKQLTLSSLSRDSQFAFYAADSAAECALYWDSRFSYFAASSSHPSNGTCDGDAFVVTWASTTSYPYVALFQTEPNGKCAFVTVTKCNGVLSGSTCTSDPGPYPAIRTRIRADGYNVACSATTTITTVLQRTIELNY